MISIDQIQTIADLCDFLDRHKATFCSFDFGTHRIEFRLWLHNYVLEMSPGNNIICGDVLDDEYYDEKQLIVRLFDLDVMGWNLANISLDSSRRDGYLTTTYMSITLTR